MFGLEPSIAAVKALRSFQERNIKNILEIGTFDGSNSHLLSRLFTESEIDVCLWHSAVGLLESETNYTTFENVDGNQVLRLELHRQLDEFESDELADAISKNLQEMGVEGLEVEISNNDPDEETYDGDSFYEAYGDMWYSEDESLDEAEYRGRKVSLGKPMRGDVKKFKVFVRDPKTKNIKKVNFGDPNMRIKKSNPARRRSFRARHNCDNPGPRTKARYWSCRKW